MNYLTIYIGVVLLLFVATSLWIHLPAANGGDIKQRLGAGFYMALQMSICALGYSVFFFVLMLSIGIAIWLVLLGLVYLPADALNNAFGGRWTKDVVSSILPYIGRASASPGLFNQPILDYATLSTLVLAPAASLRTIIASHRRRQSEASSGDNKDNFSFRKNSA
ncbi:MAG: hypothetical protein AMJ53_05625 [Gammaproteobacteria bacterium SG8_11]|nr:MAG: hypothetical protein AMJ53_05625 [Gammaproteobacteria bacterium SG8_11]